MKTILHVHQANIRSGKAPPIIVRTYKGTQHCHEVKINGPATLVHGASPLSCGARVWIETQAPVEILR